LGTYTDVLQKLVDAHGKWNYCEQIVVKIANVEINRRHTSSYVTRLIIRLGTWMLAGITHPSDSVVGLVCLCIAVSSL